MSDAFGDQRLARDATDDSAAEGRWHRAARSTGDVSIAARDVHHTYVIRDERQQRIRDRIASGFKPQNVRRVHAVRGVSFDVHQGEALGIIGHNGSGKSTLLRVLAGLLPATEGAVYASDTPILLGVSAALHAMVSGRRNIYLGGTAMGMTREQIEERYDEIVDFAGVREFIDMPFRAYSSGMKARLQFSIATAIIPDILLIDEALSVGDEEFRQKSEERMAEMLDNAGTLVLVSHSLGSVRQICSRVVWLDHGVIKADGTPEDVIRTYQKNAGTYEPAEDEAVDVYRRAGQQT